jgi:hypothetical protein
LSAKIFRHPAAGEGFELPLQFLAASRDPGVSDLDFGADERLGDEVVRLGWFEGGWTSFLPPSE